MRAALVCILFVAAGCVGSTHPPASDTGVVVEVGLWPVDPVEIAGQPSRTRPAPGATVVALDASGREAAEGSTGEDGRVELRLAPGEYSIAVRACPGAMSLPKENVAVTITPGSFTEARLHCDTGIR